MPRGRDDDDDRPPASEVAATSAAAIRGLADETRLRTLLVLWDADDRPLGFAELRRRVGVADPGQFRYHLRKLEDRFLRRTGEGYDITMAGINVVWAIRSGTLSPETTLEPFAVDGDCSTCGGSLVLSYEDELLLVTCRACERVTGMIPFYPSGLIGRSEPELLAAYEQVVRMAFQSIAHDVCPRCYGSGSVALVTDERAVPVDIRSRLTEAERAALATGAPENADVLVVWACSQCGLWFEGRPEVLLCYRPPVAAFYRDHGVDVDAMRSWELVGRLGDPRVTVVQRDPLSLRVVVTLGDDTLTVSMEDGFAAVSTAVSSDGEGSGVD